MADKRLIERFDGESGRPVLEEVLLEQKLVVGDKELGPR